MSTTGFIPLEDPICEGRGGHHLWDSPVLCPCVLEPALSITQDAQ